VINLVDFRCYIMDEFHRRPYVDHPSYQKIKKTTNKSYYWPGMKQDISHYIAKCLEFQQVKVEQGHPIGLLQPIQIPEWKWEVISMDFVTGLPKTIKQHDEIMDVVDKLRKEAHFIPIKYTYKSIDVEFFHERNIQIAIFS